MHIDKHCIKMILEYCQLLSTAHRVLDGKEASKVSPSGRMVRRWTLSDARETILYSATHMNHPSAVWCRISKHNYAWLHELLVQLCAEYTYRYGKVHKCQETGLVEALRQIPNNIKDAPFSEPTPAMPDDVKVPKSTGKYHYDSIASYRNYYIKNKQHFASWSGKLNSREVPNWFTNN
jgi:hypothetical protein